MLSLISAQWHLLRPFLNDIGQGALMTIAASVAAFAIGLVLGAVLLIVRTQCGRAAASVVIVYVSLIRGVPALIQMLVAYYVLPTLLNVQLSPVSAGILALALNTAAYISEIFRGAYGSLGRGQVPASKALGLNRVQTWRYIVFPQLLFRAIPPLTNEFTMLLKASSLMSIIAVHELSTVARDATLQTGLPLQVFAVAAAIYFVILFGASTVSRTLERRVSRMHGGVSHGH